MPILMSEVQWYLSNPSGNHGFTGTGIPGNSLGKFMSVTQVNNAVPLDDLFDDILPSENVALQVDYQCVFLMNNTLTGNLMKNITVWMPLQLWTLNGASFSIGSDPTGPVAYNSASQQATFVSSSTNAPAGVTNYVGQPQSQPQFGLTIPDLQPQFAIALWLQRTATNSPQLAPQTLKLAATFTSNA